MCNDTHVGLDETGLLPQGIGVIVNTINLLLITRPIIIYHQI